MQKCLVCIRPKWSYKNLLAINGFHYNFFAFLQFLQWFSVTFVYYGLSFGSTTLGGDPYANFCLNVFVEIPGYLFAMAVMDCWGRKPILAFCQILPGAACILAGLLVGNESMAPLQVGSLASVQILAKLSNNFYLHIKYVHINN